MVSEWRMDLLGTEWQRLNGQVDRLGMVNWMMDSGLMGGGVNGELVSG